ncbi:bifunctional homocysteine S-methyltransferase/5,10-methylenetetrahydrofolate reductase [Oxobacter pfennigii]|uniref:Bifunctional homocysteine S-methyltransferase/5,10-methylenetetrahydrofolate reductase n=1 Tax=Oxobacter pfennigii TaxID=36849 RepID=A0A0P9ACA5_9CLOT|nr:homocysteine S-methyltransferase family protein [Oxobacter pfennigii]KPU42730.1 bifunctional homocysteine S-methyltransferase/5,10-methylenetetrahydrofolate reductase [Oxobacter pfennigii]
MSLDILNKPYLLFDGAMGSMLLQRGLKLGEHPEALNITNPDLIESIHKQYIDAGSHAVTTNTFGANEIRLKGCEYSVESLVRAGVKIARSAAKDKLVALDVGPTGEFMDPIGELTKDRAYKIFTDAILPGEDEGADLILMETFSSLDEAECAVLAAKKNTKLPVICTFTFEANGKTLVGHDVKSIVEAMQKSGVDALGINCSLGPKDMLPIVYEMLSLSEVPVMVQPNAGLPKIVDGKAIYAITPEEFAEYIVTMKKKGVKILGGCCGTTPDFIKAIKSSLSGL